jgi:hypothetical protein
MRIPAARGSKIAVVFVGSAFRFEAGKWQFSEHWATAGPEGGVEPRVY